MLRYSSHFMDIQARINGKTIFAEVTDVSADEILSKGYGEMQGKMLVLEPYELLYLLEKGMIAVRGFTYEELFKLIGKHRQGLSKYLVYRDLRDRGYVVKEGIEPLYSLRLYEKGTFNTSPAKYRILILNEGDDIRVEKLKNFVITSISQDTDSVIAVVDRRGEIIYYKSFLITSGSKVE